MAPGAKFSTNTSALRARSRTSFLPRLDFKSIASDFLLALKLKTLKESRSGSVRIRRPGSPALGFSSLTTSARARPGPRCRRPGLELGQVQDAHALQAFQRLSVGLHQGQLASVTPLPRLNCEEKSLA